MIWEFSTIDSIMLYLRGKDGWDLVEFRDRAHEWIMRHSGIFLLELRLGHRREKNKSSLREMDPLECLAPFKRRKSQPSTLFFTVFFAAGIETCWEHCRSKTWSVGSPNYRQLI